MKKPQIRKSSDIYKRQNTLIHKAFSEAGYPYQENKEMWIRLITEVSGQRSEVNGLSDLTLGERARLIAHFQKQGMRIFSPSVPVKIRDWKKGDSDIEYEFREDGDPQVRMVLALWAEMGYRRKSLYGLCFRLFKKDHPRWLSDAQLSHLVNVVKAKAQSKGLGKYYRKRAL